MGLPSYYVIRKFDKKARELMGIASKSPKRKSSKRKWKVLETLKLGDPTIKCLLNKQDAI